MKIMFRGSNIILGSTLGLLLGLLCSCSKPHYVEIGDSLPVWKEGYLDIHSINSGRGECTFYVLPDGTTMLVDAGEFHTSGAKNPMVEQKPDTLTRPYKVYAAYIQNILPCSADRSSSCRSDQTSSCRSDQTSSCHFDRASSCHFDRAKRVEKSIDYALATHYHMDHIGRMEKDYAVSDSGYVLTGMMALYDEIPYRTLIDRSWPEYTDNAEQKNWERFVRSMSARDGMKVEKFVLGSDTQFRLVNHPEKYPDFRILNCHVNGQVWNNGAVEDYWTDKPVSENGASAGFLLSYGRFDWFTGGDAGGNSRVAKPTALAIGRQIEAMKGHHHMSWHTMSRTMLRTYNPQVVVNQSFYSHQPWPETMEVTLHEGMPEGECRDVFLTNLHDSTYVDAAGTLAKVKAYRGHIVIRVLPAGGSFYVYMLDDNDLQQRVKSIHGPYKCN